MTEIKFKIGDIISIEDYDDFSFNDNFKAKILEFHYYDSNGIKMMNCNFTILNGFLNYKDKYSKNYYKAKRSCIINIPISKISIVKQESYTIY